LIDTIICGDCLEIMPTIEDASVNLVILDLPYNIKKAEWDKIQEYKIFVGNVFEECERVLKDNGSLYWFHNDFDSIVNVYSWLRDTSRFSFRQFIIWNKKYPGVGNEGYLQGYNEPEMLRNYQRFAEYILFFVRRESMKTEWDKTGLLRVKQDVNNFVSLREYFKWFQQQLGMTKLEIMERLGQCTDHCFRWNSSQWDLPTEETYRDLCALLDRQIRRRDYEDLRRDYDGQRRDYEEQRYTFNNQKTHHSVWNYPVEKKVGHVTPKPVALIENIIEYSSNENDIVLDPTAGSGTTAVACRKSNRHYICIEKEPEYCAIATKRIAEML
jgi:site-specific DNA-methyltransferase (adenine-specific)